MVMPDDCEPGFFNLFLIVRKKMRGSRVGSVAQQEQGREEPSAIEVWLDGRFGNARDAPDLMAIGGGAPDQQ